MNLIEQLEAKISEIKAIDHLMMLSNWDESTCMPRGGTSDRSEVIAQTAGLRRQLLISPGFGDLLEACSELDLSDKQLANVRLAKHERSAALAIPEDLLKASKRVFATSQQVWEINRPDNNWRDTQAALQTTLDIAIEMSFNYGEEFALTPYDAMLNQYEPGISQALIDPVFEEVSTFLSNNLSQIESKQQAPLPIDSDLEIDSQLELARAIMKVLRFDFNRGRLDQSAHPFSSGTINDSRITTRLGKTDLTQSLFAVIHETGHARYTQNQPVDSWMQFVGGAPGMAVHESQSLFMEMQVARSDAFLQYMHPIIKRHLRVENGGEAWSLANLRNTVRHVKRDLIRVYADEVTYPFHILLRYEIEKQLFQRNLQVSDLPDAWDHYMRELLGLDTKGNFADGCMQDIHWYSGLFGYFPCYLLGAIYAANLYQACISKIGDQSDNLLQGELAAISDWLADNIHSKGSIQEGPDLMRSVTGSDLSAGEYLSHLANRYLYHD